MPERREEMWQPIETAPKDGTPILIACSYGLGVRIGQWHDYHDNANTRQLGPRWGFLFIAGRDVDPTHWMPLPAPPTQCLGKGE